MRSIKRWSQYRIYQAKFDSLELTHLLDNLDCYIAQSSQFFKNDRTSTVCLQKLAGELIVIKRANTKSLWHAFRRLFCSSRAFKNWQSAQRLADAGVATFEVIAVVEERWGPLKGRSYLITRYLEGGIPARQYFEQKSQTRSSWPDAVVEITAMLKQLSCAWLSHHDLNLSNIILVNHQPHLVDLDSMRHHRLRWLANYYARRDQARFLKNWRELPSLDKGVAVLFHACMKKMKST